MATGADWAEGYARQADADFTKLSARRAIGQQSMGMSILGLDMNLFLATRRQTEAKEDHLTEFLAAILQSDRTFRASYAALVLGAFAARNSWDPPEIVGITTQQSYDEQRCRPDLELTLRDKKIIACEHKIEAAETLQEDLNSGDVVGQLDRYLQLPIDGVAYFRSSWLSPADHVLNHPKYIRPRRREHFLWSDLYPILASGMTDIARWVKEGFEVLGYTPPHPFIGDLADPDDESRRRNRQNFAKLWLKTSSALREMGWSVTADGISELYLRSHPRSTAQFIFITPQYEGGRTLLIRFTPSVAGATREIDGRLRSLVEATPSRATVRCSSVLRKEGPCAVVEVGIPLNELLGASTTVEEIENKLHSHVVPLVKAIDAPSMGLG